MSTTSAVSGFNAVGTSTPMFSTSQTAQSWYSCDVTRAGNTGSSGVLQVSIIYCGSTSTGQASYFSNFSTMAGLTNITNPGGASVDDYGNFRAQSVSQTAGGPINFSTTLVGTTVGVAIWGDWNNDLSFATGERMYNTAAYVSAASGSFTVPGGTPAGSYGMRIRMDWNATNPAPCGLITRGETEDYTFTVALPRPAPPPTALQRAVSPPHPQKSTGTARAPISLNSVCRASPLARAAFPVPVARYGPGPRSPAAR